MEYNTIRSLQVALMDGRTTAEQTVKYYLNNIEKTTHLNAYVEVYAEEAMRKAKALDVKIKTAPESLGKLFGCVISVKDLIVQKDHKVSAGSKMLEGFESQFSATCLDVLLCEDAIIIGRTNCDEFGMGSANTNSFFGPVSNSIDNSRISGGSSGGAAVSVQTDTCMVAIGTDTGGSVRQPASMCGVYGYKPTYGLVSRYGLVAYASSFDQAGILANNVDDISMLIEVMSVNDHNDATMFTDGYYSEQEGMLPDSLKVACLAEALDSEALDPIIRSAIDHQIETLKDQGHAVDKIHFDYLDYLVPCYYILTTAEASSNLSRFDGVRYGYRSPNAGTLSDMYVYSRTEGFGPEVKKRIMLGAFVLSEAYYDAYFTKAQQVRRLIKENLEKLFDSYDFIMLPSSPKVAWPIDQKPDDPLESYMSDIYTVLANLGGIPAISLPAGSNMEGLPYGIQVLTQVKNDKKLLAFAKMLRQDR